MSASPNFSHLPAWPGGPSPLHAVQGRVLRDIPWSTSPYQQQSIPALVPRNLTMRKRPLDSSGFRRRLKESNSKTWVHMKRLGYRCTRQVQFRCIQIRMPALLLFTPHRNMWRRRKNLCHRNGDYSRVVLVVCSMTLSHNLHLTDS